MEKTRVGEQTDLSDVLMELIASYNKMIEIVDNISGITKKTKMLSFNSAIEAARAGEAGRGFQVISKHIQELASQSEAANNTSLVTIGDMNRKIHDVVGVRTADIAFDILDKIERHLFERYCDVQVWANNEVVIKCLKENSEESKHEASELLKKIVNINVVYFDIFLADKNGRMRVAAGDQQHIGEDISKRAWFENAMKTKQVVVSDVYYSPSLEKNTVAFSCPVRDKDGEILGVLTTRFAWDYIYDIIDRAKVSKSGSIYVVNKEGVVIASKQRSDVLQKNIRDEQATINVLVQKKYGYLLEEDEKGNILSATGYSPSEGYNTYQGQGWGVVVKEPFSL